jgi:Uma2 family endonuclease
MVRSLENIPNHMVLFDVPWKTYAGMIEAFGNKRLPHVYQYGTLEIRSICKRYEVIRSVLGQLIEMGSMQLGASIRSVGSTTRQDQKLEQGIEPYESYYVGANARVSSARRSDARRRAAPDLMADVEWNQGLLPKLKTYAALGVREVWIYHEGTVKFHALSPNAEYETVNCSVAFPPVTSKKVTQLARHICKTSQNELMREFLTHLQEKQESSELY